MAAREKVNILIVDDQPAKILSLEAILAELGENVIKAESAEEALLQLLHNDVAVVLIDVCMPRMDGFELAEMIRAHPRYSRTAIIFISAVHLSDADRMRGYGLGAVDYIPVPIMPEMLRAKVAVFAELFRKTEQLNAANRELELRVAERTTELEASNRRLRESEQNYKRLVQGLPAAVYSCDSEGRITLYNEAAAALWGREPAIGQDLWCGSWRIWRPDGSPLPLEECPMAVTLRDGNRVRSEEIVIERPDGVRRNVLPYPEPILDSNGRLVGAINMLMDITEQKAAQQAMRESESKFRTLADNMAQLAWMADGDGSVFWFNSRWFEFTGLSLEDSRGWGWARALHPDHAGRVIEKIRSCFATGEAWEDTFLTRAADGTYRWFLSRAFPVKNEDGRVRRWFGTGTDVTEQREAQQVLTRDREMLERLVAERTAELGTASERLRLSERMATIGTLSAGLGHDMGNLLLPVRMRLESLEECDLPAAAREDVAAIRKASEYLQRLAASLRLLALDSESESHADASTRPQQWWQEAEGMIRNGVARHIKLSASIAADLPPVRIGKASLTQVVFNLVQNASDALAGHADGQITVSCEEEVPGQSVAITVSDNGPGMSEEARRRCLEPFFTTKTRELSTGLGLTLVKGIVVRAQGLLTVESIPGKGSTFRLVIPTDVSSRPLAPGPGAAARRVAIVTVDDIRVHAHVRSVLGAMRIEVGEDPSAEADFWITESDNNGRLEEARSFVAANPARLAIVLGRADRASNSGSRVVRLDPSQKPSQFRAGLHAVLSHARDIVQEQP